MLLTIAGLGAILLVGMALGTFLYLSKNPPVIHMDLPDMPPIVINADFSNLIPTPLVIQSQLVPMDQKPSGIPEEPMPFAVFQYCSQESEEFAKLSRQRYARQLRNELGSWDAALIRLKQEDGV